MQVLMSHLDWKVTTWQRAIPWSRCQPARRVSFGEVTNSDSCQQDFVDYSGEFSHWNFSKMLHRRLQCLDNGTEENDVQSASQLFSALFVAVD